jgi:hypothetical protein
MRVFHNKSDLLSQRVTEGEIIEVNGKIYRASINRDGPLNNSKEILVLHPLPSFVVTSDTEIVIS